ncbi:filamentous hemagglutinin N-terminal domain-containing protein [Candidatus Gracilibacteria bacterium]|nr:filamentous hemagglutinin N-terminal domain-containing protein [Candidatus Gracilibacteria bacterium]MCF7897086.1 filamentous hemagglutinin N-terminal domain-containing protein [Candidatus Gracilibacteria bacterium]
MCFLITLLVFPVSLYANPQDGNVVQGSANISQAGKNLTINQSTDKAIINWGSFSINTGELTQFVQPSANSIALNRVIGNDPSQIFGRLSANGKLMLINQNGILFGKGSRIDVHSLIATTHDIRDENFMAGHYRFTIPGKPNASVINEGNITAAAGGLVALVAPWVENSGVISARLGRVVLAGGDTFTLDLYGDQLINFAVDSNDAALSALVRNSGEIFADGGSVLLTVDAAKNVVSGVINTDGLIQARTAEMQNGKIVLLGGDSGTVVASGILDASGKEAGESGGTVQVLGSEVSLLGTIDVSGDTGGGAALIGGDYRGRGEILTAENTYVGTEANIYADAITDGNGGKIIVWADDTANVYGSLTASGGENGGNGGFIETSGKELLNFRGTVDASAVNGEGGTWLLDPRNVAIFSGVATANGSFDGGDPNKFTPTGDSSLVDVSDIEAVLNTGTSVQISTGTTGSEDGKINVSTDITKSAGGDATLALYSANNIYTANNGISIQSTAGELNVIMNSATGIFLPGLGDGGMPVSIMTNGGDVDLTASNYFGLNGTIDAGAGDVNIRSNDTLTDQTGFYLYTGSHIYGNNINIESTGVVWDQDMTTDFNTSIEGMGNVTLKGSQLGGSINSLQVVGGNGNKLTVTQSDSLLPNYRQWVYLYVDKAAASKRFGEIDVTLNDNDKNSGLSIKFDGSTDRIYMDDNGDFLSRRTSSTGWTPDYAIDTSEYGRDITLSVNGLSADLPSDLVNTGIGAYKLFVDGSLVKDGPGPGPGPYPEPEAEKDDPVSSGQKANIEKIENWIKRPVAETVKFLTAKLTDGLIPATDDQVPIKLPDFKPTSLSQPRMEAAQKVSDLADELEEHWKKVSPISGAVPYDNTVVAVQNEVRLNKEMEAALLDYVGTLSDEELTDILGADVMEEIRITIQEAPKYAALAEAVYDFSEPEGWEIVRASDSDNSPLAMFKKTSDIECALYQNKSTGEVVVAFRGTEIESSTDMVTNFTPAALSAQVKDAKQFMKILQDSAEELDINFGDIKLTGHSLGGYLAQQMSKELGLIGYTFNAKAAGIKGQEYDAPVKNIRVGFDQWVGATDEFLGKDVGSTIIIPKTSGHSIKNLKDILSDTSLIKLNYITPKLGGVDGLIIKLRQETKSNP